MAHRPRLSNGEEGGRAAGQGDGAVGRPPLDAEAGDVRTPASASGSGSRSSWRSSSRRQSSPSRTNVVIRRVSVPSRSDESARPAQPPATSRRKTPPGTRAEATRRAGAQKPSTPARGSDAFVDDFADGRSISRVEPRRKRAWGAARVAA